MNHINRNEARVRKECRRLIKQQKISMQYIIFCNASNSLLLASSLARLRRRKKRCQKNSPETNDFLFTSSSSARVQPPPSSHNLCEIFFSGSFQCQKKFSPLLCIEPSLIHFCTLIAWNITTKIAFKFSLIKMNFKKLSFGGLRLHCSRELGNC